jgi:DNA-binding NtrC family response regulator
MIGKSPAFLEIIKLIDKIAACDAPVLIEGETGTGKELAARAIHYLGPRRDRQFVPVNCGAMPDSLIENELFGHQRGAFTDAKHDHKGLVSLATWGTLFFDEIDALSPKGQVTLLRFLQDRHYRPLGAAREESANVRIIAATNANLIDLAERGQFRRDLLYRLRILSLELPALRDRAGDITLLAQNILGKCNASWSGPEKRFHPDTLACLERYTWPGNIRELENVIFRAFQFADGRDVLITALPDMGSRKVDLSRAQRRIEETFNQAKAKAVAEFEKSYLWELMQDTKGNVTEAARRAGKERRCLGKLLKKHGIAPHLSRNGK